MLTLVTVIYGDDRRYRVELYGSVLSALAQRTDEDTRVVVYTDRHLDDFPLPITERIISAAEWHDWTRGSGITHLVKLHLVRLTLEEGNGPVIYFDTDTLFLCPPEQLAARLAPDVAMMHADEGPIANHDVWDNISAWLGDGRDVCGYTLSRASVMYNSGIVGVVAEHRDALLRSIDIADALHDVDPIFSLDQFSTGAALGHQARVDTCAAEVLHYWGWNRVFIRDAIDDFWRNHDGAPVDALCAAFNPAGYAHRPAITRSARLIGRWRQYRYGLNADGRFACIALQSAIQSAIRSTSQPTAAHTRDANNWFTVHLSFVDKQAAAKPAASARLMAELEGDYARCRSWLSADNAAGLQERLAGVA